MKKVPLLLSAFFAASLLSTSLVADPSAAASGPRTRTEPALECLIGLEPDGCQDGFASPGAAWWNTTYCTVQYIHRELDNCYDGRLETAEYLGTNTVGDDVYVVKYMHTYMTYVIQPPAPDGKIHWFWITRGLPIQVIPSHLVDVTAPAAHKMTLYRFPSE
ncbi:MAG TPA: hypothetical protein VHX18_09420 [Rhizomicrobium sp.]|nr:hypothetical protein [Rhizomicrobium sp.]